MLRIESDWNRSHLAPLRASRQLLDAVADHGIGTSGLRHSGQRRSAYNTHDEQTISNVVLCHASLLWEATHLQLHDPPLGERSSQRDADARRLGGVMQRQGQRLVVSYAIDDRDLL
jgi:hypothetical protein